MSYKIRERVYFFDERTGQVFTMEEDHYKTFPSFYTALQQKMEYINQDYRFYLRRNTRTGTSSNMWSEMWIVPL